MSEVVRIGVLWAWALWMALVEIEIEGRHGWAVRLPTWYRVGGPAGRAYAVIANGRPLTGYHLFMATMPLIILHLPFGYGVDWSAAAEAMVLATYLAWVIAWDYLWFVLNPAFGVARFRRGRVWWYPGRWIGPLPADYYISVAASFAVAGLAWALGGGAGALADQARLVAGLALLTLAAIVAAPLYRRWYAYMRRPGADERDRVLEMASRPGEPGRERGGPTA